MCGRVINSILYADTAQHTSMLREASLQQAHNKTDFPHSDLLQDTHPCVKMLFVGRHRLAKLSSRLVNNTSSTHSLAYSNVCGSHATVTLEGLRSNIVAGVGLATAVDPIIGASPPSVRR